MLTYMEAAALGLAALGWLLGPARHMPGQVRLLLIVTAGIWTLASMLQGLTVAQVIPESIGAPIDRLSKLLLYGLTAYCALVALLNRVHIQWRGWWALIVFGVSQMAAGALATVPGTVSERSLPPLCLGIFGAVALSVLSRERVLRILRGSLAAVCVGSVLYWVVDAPAATSIPQFGTVAADVSSNYEESLIGLSTRLHGLTGHANGLGFIAVIVLLTGFLPGARFGRWERAIMPAALFCLILSQNKTGWGAFTLAMVAMLTVRAADLPPVKRLIARLLGISMIVGGLVYFILGGTLFESADTTLTGRTEIWGLTLQEFQANPLAGYGPDLWGETYREAAGLPWVGHAHNQVVQTAGQTGLIGLAGLASLLISMGVLAWRNRKATAGLSVAILVALVVRGISEAPLALGANISTLTMLLILVVILFPQERRSA